MNYLKLIAVKNQLEEIQDKDVIDIEGTIETPHIYLNRHEGIIRFGGRSLPENAKDFFEPVMAWLSVYAENPKPLTSITFIFEYFNTASSKNILDMIQVLKNVKLRNGELKIDWHYYEDDDIILETGEIFSEISKIDFVFHPFS